MPFTIELLRRYASLGLVSFDLVLEPLPQLLPDLVIIRLWPALPYTCPWNKELEVERQHYRGRIAEGEEYTSPLCFSASGIVPA